MPNWSDVLTEIKGAPNPMDSARRKYLRRLSRQTGRNVIAYYSGFLSKPGLQGAEINDEDKNGFMMAVHRLKRDRGLDLILHTPGGGLSATQSIVHYLRQMFGNDIRAIVPQIALSAGTMIACSCKEILMGKHSSLGPIDPQLAGVPAYGVLEEFKEALKAIKDDPATIPIWQTIIGKYHPTFLSQCENAINLSNEFVEEQLTTVMFRGENAAKQAAEDVVKKLTDFRGNKAHDRHIHLEECLDIGLKVAAIEDDDRLQDTILTVHHTYMHGLTNTPALKIIENHLGAAFIKQAPAMQAARN